MRVTLPAFPQFNILAPETLSINLPQSVLLSGQPVPLAQTVEVLATGGYATTAGSLALQGGGSGIVQPCCNREDYLSSPHPPEPVTLVIRLHRDHFEPGIELPGSAARAALLASIRAVGTNELRGAERLLVVLLRRL